MKRNDPAAVNRAHSIRDFIMNILCSQQGVGVFRILVSLKAVFQILFTLIQYSAIFLLH